MKLKILDLFSGLGGFSLGLERTGSFETIAFCDNDKYSKLLLQKHWKGVKIYNDVKEITKEKFIADGIQFPDIITGGFPCQPFSVAGKQAGTDDDRHLWPVMFRIIQEFTPRWVIGENVKGLTNIQDGVVFETVCTDLEGEGYEVRTFNIPAAGVGAPHRRERLWIVAHRKESMVNTDDVRLEQHNETKEEPSWWRTSTTFEPTSDVADTISNDKGREISRSDEEERGIQEEHRQDDSSSRLTSRTSSIRQTNNGHEDMEDSRRTLQSRTELREKNEDEVGKGYANQHQRSGSTSESNVADTISRNVEAGRERQRGIRKESQGQGTSSDVTSSGETVANTYARLNNGTYEEVQSRGQTFDTSSEGSTDVANTESSIGYDNETISGDGGSSTQEVFGNGGSISGEGSWWHTEPDVGRVAHGIPGRVYRLKGLGNSIVPKIAEEIGKAIIKAEKE
jgi:DNA (cytosine-5)-methyltransferase 1